jgi:hypothetical protein
MTWGLGAVGGSGYNPNRSYGEQAPVNTIQQFPAAVPGLAGSVATQAATAADPFAEQRGQYQGLLQNLMQGPQQGQVNSDISSMRDAAQKPMGGPYMSMLEKLMTDKDSITQTPGSQFAMEQGQQALARSKAAGGFLGSGNIMSELQKQAQGQASQDYSQQLSDLRAAAGLSQGMQGQGFQQAAGIAGASGGALQDQYSRLAQLSGANTGSPGAAGSLLAKQFDWANQGGGGSGGAMSSGGSEVWGGGVNERNDPLGSTRYATSGFSLPTGLVSPYLGGSSSMVNPQFKILGSAMNMGTKFTPSTR